MESKPYRNLANKAANAITSSNSSQDPAATNKQVSAENAKGKKGSQVAKGSSSSSGFNAEARENLMLSMNNDENS